MFQQELQDGEDVARCPSCSLIIRVIYDLASQLSLLLTWFIVFMLLYSFTTIIELLHLPKKEVMFSLRSVCLSVCPSDNWKSCERILTKFLGGVWHGPGTKGINFGDNPDHRLDPVVRSLKSGFTGLSKKYLSLSLIPGRGDVSPPQSSPGSSSCVVGR